MKKNTYQSYGSISKFFHWTIFILVTVMLIYGYSMGYVSGALKPEIYNIHKLLGLVILALMILRTIWALKNPKPKLPSKTPLWQIAAARLMHFAFYIVLLAMPLAGWIMTSAAGKPPYIFNISLGLPIAENSHLAHTANSVHLTLAIIIIVMIIIHSLAALKHHFIDKDNVLKRIMPGYKAPYKKF